MVQYLYCRTEDCVRAGKPGQRGARQGSLQLPLTLVPLVFPYRPGLGIPIHSPPPPISEFGREKFKNNNRKSAGKFLLGNNNNKLLKFKKQIKIKLRAETEQQTLRL